MNIIHNSCNFFIAHNDCMFRFEFFDEGSHRRQIAPPYLTLNFNRNFTAIQYKIDLEALFSPPKLSYLI